MNNLLLTEIMMWLFGLVALISWVIYTAEKDIAKKKEAARASNDAADANESLETKKEESGKHLGTLIISLIGLVFSIVMYISEKSDYNALLTKFKKGDDIYCYSSTTEREQKTHETYAEALARCRASLGRLQVIEQHIDSLNRWHGVTLGE